MTDQGTKQLHKDPLKEFAPSEDELLKLQDKFVKAYRLVIITAVILLLFSSILLLIAILGITGILSSGNDLRYVFSAVIGVLLLTILLRFRLDEKIHRIMGDMSQITLALSSYHTQVRLQVAHVDTERAKHIDEVCENLMEITRCSMELIQMHYKNVSKKVTIDELLDSLE